MLKHIPSPKVLGLSSLFEKLKHLEEEKEEPLSNGIESSQPSVEKSSCLPNLVPKKDLEEVYDKTILLIWSK